MTQKLAFPRTLRDSNQHRNQSVPDTFHRTQRDAGLSSDWNGENEWSWRTSVAVAVVAVLLWMVLGK